MLFTPRAQSRFLDLGLLLRGCRPKSRSLPCRVEVIHPVVRACTTFWLTSTRITLTRVHRRPVDRAACAALRLIDFTHVRVYSKATHDDFFSAFSVRSNDRTKTSVCLLSFLLRSLRLTKTVLKLKKRPCKRSSRLSCGLLESEYFQSEKQRSLDDQRHRSDGLH